MNREENNSVELEENLLNKEDKGGIEDVYERGMVDEEISREKKSKKKKRKKDKKKKKKKKKKGSIPICGIFKLRYYQQYVEATTSEVIQKLIWSIFFLSGKFTSVAPEKTDLYGPFWIMCTMVLSLTFSQNLYSYFSRPEVINN